MTSPHDVRKWHWGQAIVLVCFNRRSSETSPSDLSCYITLYLPRSWVTLNPFLATSAAMVTTSFHCILGDLKVMTEWLSSHVKIYSLFFIYIYAHSQLLVFILLFQKDNAKNVFSITLNIQYMDKLVTSVSVSAPPSYQLRHQYQDNYTASE